jgi:hypothetical protein
MNQCSRSVVIIDQTLILIIAAGSRREQSSETAIRENTKHWSCGPWRRSSAWGWSGPLNQVAAAAGVASQGVAGSSIETISKLRCSIDPNEIMQKAGEGAECSFETGQ